MKTTLQTLTKKALMLGFGVMAYAGTQAQCVVNTAITTNAPGDISTTTTMTIQSGWEHYTTVNFGDGTSGNTYGGNTATYNSGHYYTANGTYYVTTNMFSYDPADSVFNCMDSDVDTVIVSGIACSVNVTAINYSQNGSSSLYNFSTTVSSGSDVSLYWSVRDSMGGWVYGQPGGTAFNYNFTQSGYYTVQCSADAYDSISTQSCYDSSYVYIYVADSIVNGCNIQAYVNVTPTTGLGAVIASGASGNYNYSYITVDTQIFYNTDSIMYTFPAAGNYYVCYYAFDTTSTAYCYDSLCVLYNTNGSNPIQCNASFNIYQDSINPTIWYGFNNSTGSPNVTYTWDFGDGNFSNLPYPYHTYAVPGNYTICLTVTDSINSCTSTYCDSSAAFRLTNALIGSLYIAAPTGIKDNAVSVNEIKLYPNPMSDFSSLSFNSSVISKGKVEVVSMLGATLISENVSIEKGSNEFKINTSALANGIYYVNIVSENRTLITVKAVK